MQAKNNSLLSYKPLGTALLSIAITAGLFVIFGSNGWGMSAEKMNRLLARYPVGAKE